MAVPGLLGKVGKAASEIVPGGLMDQIRAYHGSPHDFPAERLVRLPDGREEFIVGQPGMLPEIPSGAQVLQEFPYGRFRMEKMGTGEGAQAYGAGMYAAEAKKVAEEYKHSADWRTKTSKQMQYKVDGETVSPLNVEEDVLLNYAINNKAELAGIVAEHKNMAELSKNKSQEYFSRSKNETGEEAARLQRMAKRSEQSAKDWQNLANFGEKLKSANVSPATGKMYELDINAKPEELLDWDKPLSEQSETVRKALLSDESIKDAITKRQDQINRMRRENIQDDFGVSGLSTDLSGQDLYNLVGGVKGVDSFGFPKGNKTAAQNATEELNKLGIKGIRYKDAMSRGAEGGTNNFVVFDPNIIEIARKYGIPVPAAAAMLAGGLTPDRAAQAALAGQMSPAGLMQATGGFTQASQALRQAEQNRRMPAMRGEMSGPQTAIQRGAFDVGMAADRAGLGGTAGAYMNVSQGVRPGLIDAILSGVELSDAIGPTQLGQGLLSR